MVKVMALLLPLIAAGCTTPVEFCDIARPIRPALEDTEKISTDLVNQILSHNEKGAELCRWR